MDQEVGDVDAFERVGRGSLDRRLAPVEVDGATLRVAGERTQLADRELALTEHREQLDSLTHALLDAETLDAPDAYAAARVPLRTAELEPTPH